ncbi:hypothetical protein [Ensifer aridi]|nr:hypothetical protein [Ensifer aridi]
MSIPNPVPDEVPEDEMPIDVPAEDEVTFDDGATFDDGTSFVP